MRAFNPAFWHLSSILGPRGHVKIESDSQAACFTEWVDEAVMSQIRAL